MATAMAPTSVERAVLEEEFRWLLHDEVHAVLRQLQDILKEASLRFTLPGSGMEGPAKQENFILGSSGTDQVKGVLTLQGDALSQAVSPFPFYVPGEASGEEHEGLLLSSATDWLCDARQNPWPFWASVS
uniref:Protein rogdi homolog n=1 Tax=Pipistrellus kuhlii TaxID=59472 RepID=A0A7J7YZE9_PIPKU|nr:rogdi atypical leucine zipper [Pipistrellus kuhlii]